MAESEVMPTNLPAIKEDAPTTIMNIIADAAKDPAFDVAKLDKLISLKNEMDDRTARLAYVRDYAPMKAELPKILKNKKNTHTSSEYADLAQINEAVDPILGKYGFATTQKVVGQTENTITIRAEILHRDGHSDSMEVTFPIDNTGSGGKVNKTVIQGMSSTISYLKRVAKCTMLDIAAGDDEDGNDLTPSPFITMEQAVEIDTRLMACAGDKEVFLKFLDAPSVREIPAQNYRKAIANLANKERQQKLAAEGKTDEADAESVK